MHSTPKISVIITTHNRKEKVIRTIKSVLSSYSELLSEIIVIDDASNDGTHADLKDIFSKNNIRLFRYTNEQLVSECRNIGMRNAKEEYVLFLDDDVIVPPTAISDLFKFLMQNENVACVIPLILYYNKPNVIWSAGVKHNFWTTVGGLIGHNELDRGQFSQVINSDSVLTAFMVRRSIASKLNFDSKNFPIGWEDMDFTTRIKRAGYEVKVLPWIKVWHDYPGAHFLTNKLRLYFEVRNRIIFHRRWSNNTLQYVTSVLFSSLVGLSYIISGIFFSRNIVENTKTIFRALADGLCWKFK